MARKSRTTCKTTKEKTKPSSEFTESEIQAAEQLVQLSEESNNGNSSSQGSTAAHHEELSDCGTTTHVPNSKDFNMEEEEPIGSLIRIKKRYKSIYDLYKLTKPL